jgi:hypothetical protein
MAEDTPQTTTSTTPAQPKRASTQPATPPRVSDSPSTNDCEVGKGCDREVKYKATSDDLVVYSCEVHCQDIDDTFPGMTFVVEPV